MTDVPDGFLIRDLASLDDYRECVVLQDETWGNDFAERVPPAILRVAQYVGGVSAGAFDADGRMVGFVFGLTGVRHGALVHWSDMLAVRHPLRGRHLGAALKAYQRRKVRDAGVERMMWTFDPLVARNAHFNINRLGAMPVEYVPNMYGQTGSTLLGSLPTDRFIASWDLQREHTAIAGDAAGRADDDRLPVANPVEPDGAPRYDQSVTNAASAVRVQIPRDLSEVDRPGSDHALRWRLVVREAVFPLLERGYRVSRFVPADAPRHPYYVLSPP